MKKTVQIVTIPLNKEGWNKGDIVEFITNSLKRDVVIAKVDCFDELSISISPNYKNLQLLVLSDDKIQEGDTFLDSFGKIDTYLEGEFQPASSSRKIIASYPQLSTTLPISKETVQAWIDSGTPGEGVIFYDNEPDNLLFDPQGNLLLEFGKKDEDYYDEDIYDAVIDFRKKHPEKVSVVKPSILTDEEIDRICVRGCHDFILEKGIMTPITPQQYYTAGYKQALKDLGYE